MNVFESILHDIKQSRALQEDIESVKRQPEFSGIDDDKFMQIIALDPTFTGKNSVGTYGKWLLRLYKKGALVEDEFKFVTDALEMFDKVKRALPNKDIQQFKTFDALVQALSEVDEEKFLSMLTPSQRVRYLKDIKAGRVHVKEEDDFEIAYEDSDWIVYIPHTHAASMKLGKGTDWCTAHENPEYWEQYTSNGKLYILKNKHSGIRYQYSNTTGEFRDEADDNTNIYDLFDMKFGIYKFLNSLDPNRFPNLDFEDGILITDCTVKVPIDLQYSVVEVIIEDGVEEIPKEMFSYFVELDTVTIPDSVIKIGDGAFEGCESLKEIELPNSLQVIGHRAFNSAGIRHINIPPSVDVINGGAFASSDIESVVINSNDLVVYTNGFAYCANLKSVKFNIDDSAAFAFGEGVFKNCPNLREVELPDGCSIGEKMFCECENLKRVTYNGKNVGGFAFSYCENLETVILGENVKTIESAAFMNCDILKNINIPNSVESIGSHAFCGCGALTKVAIPNGVTKILPNTFQGCRNLVRVDIPESVTMIGYRAFAMCDALEDVRLPNGLESIDNNAFVACKNIKELTVPDSVKTIGASAFMGTGIERIKLSSNLEACSETMLGGCASLKSVVFPESVKHFGDGPFVGCNSLETVTILADDATCTAMCFDMMWEKPKFMVRTNSPAIRDACKKAGVRCVGLNESKQRNFRLNIKE